MLLRRERENPVQIFPEHTQIPARLLQVFIFSPFPLSLAAMESSDGPMLKLAVEKGRRKGESAEFKWGTVVTIGRVIRGNNFPIKDPSISQSHVSIAGDGGGGWSIADLGSSNGTFLNGVAIEPEAPAELRHGDTIKIGERTTIRVEIVRSIKGEKDPTVEDEDRCRGKRARAKSEEKDEEREEEKDGFDMGKMTLEEWFDNMEKYLPKVIRGIADEAIAQIKADAEKVNEYLQHGCMKKT